MRQIDLIVEGQPLGKARPRVTSRGTYTPKVNRLHAEALAWHIKVACRTPIEGPVEVTLAFFRANAHRIDLDNLVKQVLDAANGVAWKDDSQVVALYARKEVDPQHPRLLISIQELEAA